MKYQSISELVEELATLKELYKSIQGGVNHSLGIGDIEKAKEGIDRLENIKKSIDLIESTEVVIDWSIRG